LKIETHKKRVKGKPNIEMKNIMKKQILKSTLELEAHDQEAKV